MTTAATADAITASTRAIAGLWPLLLTSLGNSTSSGTPSSDTVTALDRRVDLSRDITTTLARIAHDITSRRDLTHDLPSRNNLPGLCTLIQRHAEWLSGQDDGPRAADQLLEHARELRAALAPKRRDWVHLGTCPIDTWNPDTETIETCAGRVRARIGTADGTASCESCGTVRSIAWWQWELGLTKPPLSAEAMAKVLHDRMGVTVTGRTVRNWARAGHIDTYLEPFGPAPQWPRFDQETVMLQVAQMGRGCQMCGELWHGAGDVCTRCYVAAQSARPRRAQPKVATPVLGGKPAVRPQPFVPLTQKLAWCDGGDMPAAWCVCGRDHQQLVGA